MPEQYLLVRQRDENHSHSPDPSPGDEISRVDVHYLTVEEMRAAQFGTKDYMLMRIKPQDAHGFKCRVVNVRLEEETCGALKKGSSSMQASKS